MQCSIVCATIIMFVYNTVWTVCATIMSTTLSGQSVQPSCLQHCLVTSVCATTQGKVLAFRTEVWYCTEPLSLHKGKFISATVSLLYQKDPNTMHGPCSKLKAPNVRLPDCIFLHCCWLSFTHVPEFCQDSSLGCRLFVNFHWWGMFNL